MTLTEHERDAMLDRNLRAVGKRLRLPDEPTPAQRARWKQMTQAAAGEKTSPPPSSKFRRSQLPWRMISGGAIAAALLFAVLFTQDRHSAVSAETIFAELRHAMALPIWIEIENADFGVSVLNGRIYREPDSDDDESFRTFFSEIAVLMRADNPEWHDYEALAARYKHESGSWRFYRGDGTGEVLQADDGRYYMPPPETLYIREGKPDRAVKPGARAGSLLGAIPTGMRRGYEGEGVQYRSTVRGEDLFSEVMDLLDDLIDPESAIDLLAQLYARTDDVQIHTQDDRTLRLKASGIRDVRSEPAVAHYDMTFTYDLERERVDGSSLSIPRMLQGERNDALSETASKLWRQVRRQGASLEEFIEALNEIAEEVEVDRSDPDKWIIHGRNIRVVEGMLPGPELAPDYAAFLAGIEIVIDYDPHAATGGRVVHAEFRNIGDKGGIIRVTPATQPLDEHLTDPYRLISEHTRIVELSPGDHDDLE